MSDEEKKSSQLEAEFRKLVIDELKSIGGKQDQTTESLNKLSNEFNLHKLESQQRWNAIEILDNEQNAILAEHRSTGLAQMEANKIARAELETKVDERIAAIEPRIVKLEEPYKFKKTLIKVILTIGSLAGAIYATGRLFGWF